MNVKHDTFMRLALAEAQKAFSAGQFPVGCVLVVGDEVMATGGRENSDIPFSELDHAEIVALRNLQSKYPEIDLEQVVIYSTLEPCLMCYSTLLVNNVSTIVYGFEDVMGGGTSLPIDKLAPLYKGRDITVVKNVLRDECLHLFQQFFKNPLNTYLQNTLLAEYTLKQECNLPIAEK
jgi:tRNA(adenine34) deaminase